MRRWLAIAAYAVLLGLTFWTISDRRILLVAAGVLVAFMGLTLFHKCQPAPVPWGRAADMREGVRLDLEGVQATTSGRDVVARIDEMTPM